MAGFDTRRPALDEFQLEKGKRGRFIPDAAALRNEIRHPDTYQSVERRA